MPIDCTIDHAHGLVKARAHGKILLPEVVTYFDRVVVDGAMPYRKLFDGSLATSDLSEDEMMELGARASAYKVFAPRGPLAIVVGPHSLLDAYRFANLARAERPIEMFESVERANAWLLAQSMPTAIGPGPTAAAPRGTAQGERLPRRDATDVPDELERDMRKAQALVNELAKRHGLSVRDVTEAMQGGARERRSGKAR